MATRDNYDPRRRSGRNNDYYPREDQDWAQDYDWDLVDQDGYYSDGGDCGYQDQGVYDDGYYDGYDDGYYPEDDGYYYDDGGYEDDYYYEEPRRNGPSMAARAAGKSNTEIYGRPKSRSSQPRDSQRRSVQSGYTAPRQRSTYDYEDTYVPKKKKRRKKRHPFRNFLIFCLILAALVGGIYYMLFRAPDQWTDGYHTRKDGLYNILICATDEEEMRTDTMMIATLDQEQGSISLTSLPRDTIVDNGEYVPKLNGVYGIAGGGEAGAEALMDQVQTLLGFRPDGYAIIDYQIFKDAVDAMGGVVFDVPMDMVVDNANDPNDILEIPAGEQLLDGTAALGVCRYRYGYLMADIQRQYVQQSFLKAMIQQLCSADKLTKLPAVYEAAMSNVKTNLSGANVRYLALKVILAGLGDIQQNTLPGEGVTYNGASCYGLYGQSVVDMVNASMNPFEEDITLDDVHILTVSGGTLVESTWSGAAFDASEYQYD